MRAELTVRSAAFLLRSWGCVFILAPALTILAEDASIYTALYTLSAIGQLALFIIVAVVLTGLATNAAQAAVLVGPVFALRITQIYWIRIAEALPVFDRGTSVVCATALAVLYYQLVVRIRLDGGVAMEIEPETFEVSPENGGTARIERFLASVNLTEREREIAVRVLQGETSRAIAVDLGITGSTVNSHVLNIAAKFGVSNRKALLMKCMEF